MIKRYMWSFAEKFGQGLFVSDKGDYVKYEDYAALQQKLDALAQLAEERRQFIVNGVDMGYINLPVIDEDKANGIYARCLLKPKFACDAYLNSVRAEGVDGFIEKSPYVIPHRLKAALSNYATRLRSGTHDTADKAG